MRETSVRPCAVCGKPTIAFNYGVNCCNACKQFYKRMKDSKNIPTNCRMGGNCSKCRYCRYQMCLAAGLRPPVSSLPMALTESRPQLPAVLQYLEYLELQRHDTFANYILSAPEFNLEEFVLSDSSTYTKKSSGFVPTFSNWTTQILSTSIDLIKRFELTRALSKSEKMDFVMSSFRTHATLCIAMRSYSNQKEGTEFPGGMDTVPRELADHYDMSPKVLSKIRCTLVAKLRDLGVTSEEFLLLSALLICTPGVPGTIFSTSTQNHIIRYQRLFTSILMQLCMQHFQSNGPTRFSELLSIFSTIKRTLGDFDNAIIGMQCSTPAANIEKVFVDMLN